MLFVNIWCHDLMSHNVLREEQRENELHYCQSQFNTVLSENKPNFYGVGNSSPKNLHIVVIYSPLC